MPSVGDLAHGREFFGHLSVDRNRIGEWFREKWLIIVARADTLPY